MKKTVFILIAALLAFCACQKPAFPSKEEGRTYRLSELQFDFHFARPDATKGVRTGWVKGDKVFIFFKDVSTAYVTVTYNGSSWSVSPELPDGMSEPALSANGYLTAVYLPYGNDATPSWNGTVWSFSGTNDYYFLKKENASFAVSDTDNILPTLSSYVEMGAAEGFVQFYLPDESADGSIQLACNVVTPCGIAGVAADGTVTETSPAMGSWMTARADTIDGEKGYYASGKLSSSPGLLYYFATKDAPNVYRHYYKQRTSPMAVRKAYQLPESTSWLTVSPSTPVEIAGNKWYALNAGAENPWESGTQYSPAEMGSAPVTDTMVPSDTEYNVLLTPAKTDWLQVSLLGVDGFLVLDKTVPSRFIFLPCLNYWSTSSTGDIQHYLKTAADGTHVIADSEPPAKAYVRLVSSSYSGGFDPPEGGGDI